MKSAPISKYTSSKRDRMSGRPRRAVAVATEARLSELQRIDALRGRPGGFKAGSLAASKAWETRRANLALQVCSNIKP